MRPKKITQVDINKICEALTKKRQKVTIAAVRDVTKAGSNTTISEMIHVWKLGGKAKITKAPTAGVDYKRGYRDALKAVRLYSNQLEKNLV